MNSYLVTGSAGFIGFHVSRHLLERGDRVVGVDNVNDYYSVQLKRDRLALLDEYDNYSFLEVDLADRAGLAGAFATADCRAVIHLAAQAGVRYSLEHPESYINSNLVGFGHILELCRHYQIGHLVYASSSSVYGANRRMPFSVHDNVDHPLSLYAATKKANELMAHTYSHLYGLPTTGLRFFTVYGPWGRPDMAIFRFTESILADKPIDVYNRGEMRRDFTYIDDVVEGIVRIANRVPTPDPDWNADAPDPSSSFAPYKVYNIGNNRPVELLHLISVIEQNLGKTATKNFMEMQPGDVLETYADVSELERDVYFCPTTTIEEGVARFVAWYREYYQK